MLVKELSFFYEPIVFFRLKLLFREMTSPPEESKMMADPFCRQNMDSSSTSSSSASASTMLTSGEERSLGNIFQILNQVNKLSNISFKTALNMMFSSH